MTEVLNYVTWNIDTSNLLKIFLMIHRYEDFFGSKKGTGQKKTVKSSDLSDDMGTDDDMIDDNDDNQVVYFLSFQL